MAVASQVITFATNRPPIGMKNGVNLVFEAPEDFDPDTLQIFLSGLFLDLGLDYTIANDNKTFTIVLEPSDPSRLNVAPMQNESFRLNYIRL